MRLGGIHVPVRPFNEEISGTQAGKLVRSQRLHSVVCIGIVRKCPGAEVE